MMSTRRMARGAALLCLVALMAACSPTFRNHGYIPPQDDLDQLVVGVDTRASVEEVAGVPGASGATRNGDYFYVRSRVREFLFLEPTVVERQVLAISFDSNDVVRNIETFALEDGRVVRLETRVTDSGVRDGTFLRQLIGNIGRLGPSGLN